MSEVVHDLKAMFGRDAKSLTLEELHAIARGAHDGSAFPDGIPIGVERDRRLSLESPFYFATGVLDPYYAEHFGEVHKRCMDEVMGPYLLGETVRIDGQNYEAAEYTGLGILFSRTTFKSTMLRIMAQWIGIYRKIKLGEDARVMFTHQVLEKAIEHSEAIRSVCKLHTAYRATFPEFAVDPNREWDTRAKWRYPNFTSYQATEWSHMCYGETSSKIGGHYTDRLVDDWVTDDSVTTDNQLEQSYARFVGMDHLRSRDRSFSPWLFCGTHYHFQDTYKRLENQGGWLIWRMPAHTGSPKRIFDICALEDRSPAGRRKIEVKLKRLEEDPPGELNFPHLLSWRECYRSARATGPHQYNCQLLLNPLPEGEQRFDSEALEQSWVDEIPPPSEMWVYIRCDPAISEKRSADETAIVVGGVTWDGKRYSIDGWVGREKRPSEIVRKLFTFAKRWQAKGYHVRNIGIESVQYQEALAELCRNGVPERDPTFDGESVPMLMTPCAIRSITRSPDKRKHERLLEMDGPITRRELKFWKQNPIARKQMTQFQNFPFDRFDILDATHDLWVSAHCPPAVIEDIEPTLHKEFQKLLRRNMFGKQQGQIVGTIAPTKLSNWG